MADIVTVSAPVDGAPSGAPAPAAEAPKKQTRKRAAPAAQTAPAPTPEPVTAGPTSELGGDFYIVTR